jgi:hypothetical protein
MTGGRSTEHHAEERVGNPPEPLPHRGFLLIFHLYRPAFLSSPRSEDNSTSSGSVAAEKRTVIPSPYRGGWPGRVRPE